MMSVDIEVPAASGEIAPEDPLLTLVQKVMAAHDRQAASDHWITEPEEQVGVDIMQAALRAATMMFGTAANGVRVAGVYDRTNQNIRIRAAYLQPILEIPGMFVHFQAPVNPGSLGYFGLSYRCVPELGGAHFHIACAASGGELKPIRSLTELYEGLFDTNYEKEQPHRDDHTQIRTGLLFD